MADGYPGRPELRRDERSRQEPLVFVRVIEGRLSDGAPLRRLLQRWDAELKPGATGFLGATAGASPGSGAIVFVRFVDEAAAVWDREHPEHAAWWQELMEVFDEPPAVHESTDIQLLLAGGSDDAGFVQIIRASAPDRAKVDALMTPERIAEMRRTRPDLIGSIRVWLADGSFIEAAYFTSESAARHAEQSDEYEDAEAPFVEAYGPMTFVDLPAPILLSP
jgi:hypothetical protein